MKTFPLARMIVPSLILIASSLAAQTAGAQASAAAASTTCKDGTTSTATGRGACSGHGGVRKASAGSSGALVGSTAATPRGLERPRRAPRERLATTAPTATAPKSTASVQIDRHRQYRSHRRHGEMQGRHLLEVQAPQRHLLEARRRRSVDGRLQMTGLFQ